MRQIAVKLVVVIAALCTIGVGFPANASAVNDQTLVIGINNERKNAGLPGLQWSGTLSQSASLKVQDMCTRHYWSHVSPDGKQPWAFMDAAGYSFMSAGENLAQGYADDSTVIAGWMASQTHRENVLGPQYTEVGTAAQQCNLRGIEVTVVAAHFGRPQRVAVPVTRVEQHIPSPVPSEQRVSRPITENTAMVMPTPKPVPSRSFKDALCAAVHTSDFQFIAQLLGAGLQCP